MCIISKKRFFNCIQIQQKLYKPDIMRVKVIMNIMYIMKDTIGDWMNGCPETELCPAGLT